MEVDVLSFCAEELSRLEGLDLRRILRLLSAAQYTEIEVDGRQILLFASNDYLGFANHERIIHAAKTALDRYGVGAGSARLICGHMEAHRLLESELAAFKTKEDAVLFSSGYLANVGSIPALAGEGDAIFSDELNHASIVDGVRLSKAERSIYPHMDVDVLDRRLAEHRGLHPKARRLVMTDSVFSMDGTLAPLPALADACERHGAMLMVDEAHATGVLGPGGRGAVAHFELEDRVPILMGTLSKALGSAGGFVAGSRTLCEYLRNKARSFIFDTALPPAMAAAASEGLRLLALDPLRGERLLAQTRMLAEQLSSMGYAVAEPEAAILAIHFGDASSVLHFSRDLLEHDDILVPAIRPPTVPEGGSRLRLTLSSAHTPAQIERLLRAFESRSPA